MFFMQKLKHHMQVYIVMDISKANPIKYMLPRPILNKWLAIWAIMLQQYDLIHKP